MDQERLKAGQEIGFETQPYIFDLAASVCVGGK